MDEWKEYKVADLIESGWLTIGDGYRAKNSELSHEGIPFARAANLNDGFNFEKADYFPISDLVKVGEKISRLDDIVFTSKGTVGRFGYVKEDTPRFVFSPQLCYWRIMNCDEINPQYLFYWMQGKDFLGQIDAVKGQTDMADYVNLADQKEMQLTLATLPEQTAIASVLSSLDDKIDLLHRQNKTLEALAETLFRQWFVPARRNDSAGGEEAEVGWKVSRLGDFVETTLGGEWGKEKPEDDYQLQVQCIRGTDIADLETGIAERTPVRFIKQKKFESIEMKNGDLVMEISGGSDDQSTGRTIYVNDDVKALFQYPMVFSNFCRLIRPKKAEYSSFLYSYIHHLYKQGDLFNLENGSSGIRNLNYKALLFELEFKLPEEDQVAKYGKEVENYFLKVNKNKHQIRTLTQLRDTLLPKLMNGEVRVSEL